MNETKNKLKAMNRISDLTADRDKLLAICEALVADKDFIEEDEGYAACQCAELVEGKCNYCIAKAAIAGR